MKTIPDTVNPQDVSLLQVDEYCDPNGALLDTRKRFPQKKKKKKKSLKIFGVINIFTPKIFKDLWCKDINDTKNLQRFLV